MESDRKYRQRGYMDSSNGTARPERDRPRPAGPRLPVDVTGPRLPRMVQQVVASRCFNCSTTLPPGTDFKGHCPKCGAALHCCKQCTHFDSSTRFQCQKPIPVRIAVKDAANACEFFQARVTVARDSGPGAWQSQAPTAAAAPPRTSQDARAAFDNLFKK